ncbi:MAG TPA: DUF1028 domain-containing protein [Gaiellaceae bacterium]|jgi:uncharacterized Ntn-hydrolase superfamily protein|nr:DUF1028 domain-containing protein [Gaiellaceae bacterium]
MRERWFGSTGRKVPQIAVEGELDVDGALVLDELDDEALRQAFEVGQPVVVRVSSAGAVLQALKRPEVSSVLVPPAHRELLDIDLIKMTYGTYSIAACDLEAGQWGVATQSKFLAVGSLVPWAEPHVGAVATQAYANPRYGPRGLTLLREGLSAEAVVERLTSADEAREHRQLGVVDRDGRAATYTGSECHDWAGGRTGDGYAAQGNILVSEDTVNALAETFEGTAGSPLAARLMNCLDAAQAAGGDSRGQQSAALIVVEKDGGYANLSDVLVDLRVDDHERPLEELRRIYGLHQAIFGETPREEWLPVDEELGAELRERLGRLGFDGELDDALFRWAGGENLEERVDGVEAIDPVVLEELRRQS